MVHASRIEVLQTVVALAGVIFKVWILTRHYQNKRWLIDNHFNGPRLYWAQSLIRQGWMLLTVHLAFLYVGIESLRLPPPYAGNDVLNPLATLLGDHAALEPLQWRERTWALIFATIVLSAYSGLNLRARRHLALTPWNREPWDGETDRRDGDERRHPDVKTDD